MVQWLRLRASTAGGTGLIPGIPGWELRSHILCNSAKKKTKNPRIVLAAVVRIDDWRQGQKQRPG